MEIKIEDSAWETSFFGYPVGKINAISHELKIDLNLIIKSSHDYKLIIANHRPDQIVHGFSHQETKRTYQMLLPEEGSGNNTSEIHQIKDFSRINEIFYLALIAGTFSRFRLDKQMKNYEFEKLYFEWIFKSINGEFDKEVFVFEENNKFAGLLTLKYGSNIATIGLIATLPKYQGKGIGRKLINFAMKRSKELGCEKLNVSTQKVNYQACSFYESLNFKLKDESLISQIWSIS